MPQSYLEDVLASSVQDAVPLPTAHKLNLDTSTELSAKRLKPYSHGSGALTSLRKEAPTYSETAVSGLKPAPVTTAASTRSRPKLFPPWVRGSTLLPPAPAGAGRRRWLSGPGEGRCRSGQLPRQFQTAPPRFKVKPGLLRVGRAGG